MLRPRSCVSLLCTLVVGFFALSCGERSLSEEDQELLTDLRVELEDVRREISETESESSSLVGGLVAVLSSARAEVLKTTEALLQQRIHAIESGAEVEIVVPIAAMDTGLVSALEKDIRVQRQELDSARRDLNQYSTGLVRALTLSTVCTYKQSLAMLEQRRLIAKYGLGLPSLSSDDVSQSGGTGYPISSPAEPLVDAGSLADEIIEVRLKSKRYSEQDYQDYILLNIDFTASGLDKPARAIKGVLNLNDLFGETKMRLRWTIDEPINPNQRVSVHGSGFEYNQFVDEHQWARMTSAQNMTASFTVTDILYEDGTRREIP